MDAAAGPFVTAHRPDQGPMKAGIVKEVRADEQRVATAPDGVKALIEKLGFEVVVEAGAGAKASFSDQEYDKAGA